MVGISGVVGVCKSKHHWYAEYQGVYIGFFDTVEEASDALQVFKATGKTARKPKGHGMVSTSLYNCWGHMKYRCTNSNAQGWDRYGGRGISFCDEWQAFEPFQKWAESNGYSPDLILDREDNDGNYTPDNCRWVNGSVSMFNRAFPSDHPGVTKRPCGWQCRVSLKHLGYFDTKEEAIEARRKFFETGEVVKRKVRRKRSDNKSGYSGVYQQSTGKWTAHFKGKYLGQFDTKEEAIETRKRAET